MSAIDDIISAWPAIQAEVTEIQTEAQTVLSELGDALRRIAGFHDSGDTESAKAVAAQMVALHENLVSLHGNLSAAVPAPAPAPAADAADEKSAS